MPFRVRFLIGRRAELRRDVLAVFVRALFGWQRERARDLWLGEVRSGAVTVESPPDFPDSTACTAAPRRSFRGSTSALPPDGATL